MNKISSSDLLTSVQTTKQTVTQQMKQVSVQADGAPASGITKDAFAATLNGQIDAPEKVFDEFDRDGDKKLSDQEAEAAMNSILEAGAAKGDGIGANGQSDQVALLQNQLNAVAPEQGGPAQALDVDGQFGPATEDALKNFQQANGLDPSGQVDDATAAKLQEATGLIGAPAAPAPDPAAQAPAQPAPPPPLGTPASQDLLQAGSTNVQMQLNTIKDADPKSPLFQDGIKQALNAVDSKNPNPDDLKAIASYCQKAGDMDKARALTLMADGSKFQPEMRERLMNAIKDPDGYKKKVDDNHDESIGHKMFDANNHNDISDEELTAAGCVENLLGDPNLGTAMQDIGKPGVDPTVRKESLKSMDDDGNSGDFDRAVTAANARQPMTQQDIQALSSLAQWQVGRNNKSDKDFFARARGALQPLADHFGQIQGNTELVKQLSNLSRTGSPQDMAAWLVTATGEVDPKDENQRAVVNEVVNAVQDPDIRNQVTQILNANDPRGEAGLIRTVRDQAAQIAKDKDKDN